MTPTSPRLGVDLDGCVFDFDISMRRLLCGRGCDVSLEESNAWMDADIIGVPQKEWDWMWGPGVRELFGAMPAYPGALDALRKLQARMDLVFITHRPLRVADITLLQLAHAGIRPRAVHHCAGSDKSSVDPACVAYVEDRVENVLDLAANGVPVWMPRRGWNRELHNANTERSILQVCPFDDWKEVVKWAGK